MKPIYIKTTTIDHDLTGRMIRRAREEKGLSELDLADLVGLSKSYISLLESGNRQWSDELFERIAKVLR